MSHIPRYDEGGVRKIGDPKLGFQTMLDPNAEFNGFLSGIGRIGYKDKVGFSGMGQKSYYWSNTEYNTGTSGHGAVYFALYKASDGRDEALVTYGYSKGYLFSIRCIKK